MDGRSRSSQIQSHYYKETFSVSRDCFYPTVSDVILRRTAAAKKVDSKVSYKKVGSSDHFPRRREEIWYPRRCEEFLARGWRRGDNGALWTQRRVKDYVNAYDGDSLPTNQRQDNRPRIRRSREAEQCQEHHRHSLPRPKIRRHTQRL